MPRLGHTVEQIITALLSSRSHAGQVACPMAPTSITRWSKMAGAGGIGSLRQVMLFSKGWRRRRERQGKACGPTRNRCHRGSIVKRGRGESLDLSDLVASTEKPFVRGGERPGSGLA